MNRDKMQYRTVPISQFVTREDTGSDSPHLEGYFSVYNSVYQFAPDISESIAPGAFADSLSGDIRALINHDTTLVLARTAAHTLELHDDERGLWGSISINPNDGDAMNLYERIKRGDVDGCSIGFEIIEEEADYHDDGSVHYTIKRANLFEVSACTFPAYTETSIAARTAQARAELSHRRSEMWAHKMKERLHHGIKSTDAEKED